MFEHNTTRMSELNDGQGADIDSQLVPMIKFLNRMGCETVSCCQGDPGVIGEGGHYGHVFYIIPGETDAHQIIARYTFIFLREFVRHLDDDVRLSVALSQQTGFFGQMDFRNEAIEEITKRLGCYCEMKHK